MSHKRHCRTIEIKGIKDGGAEVSHEYVDYENEDGWKLKGLEKGMPRESLEHMIKS